MKLTYKDLRWVNAEHLPKKFSMSPSLLLYRGRLPAFSQMEKDVNRLRNVFHATVQDLLENWHLLEVNPQFEFSPEWFDNAERLAKSVLNAKRIGDPRTGKPVRSECAQSQKRIAQAILQRVDSARCALASSEKLFADRCGSEIVQFFARMSSEADRMRGKKIASAEREGGRAKGSAAEKERADWQREAEDIWKRRPKLSARAVARQIDLSKIETIRKLIKRPNPR